MITSRGVSWGRDWELRHVKIPRLESLLDSLVTFRLCSRRGSQCDISLEETLFSLKCLLTGVAARVSQLRKRRETSWNPAHCIDGA